MKLSVVIPSYKDPYLHKTIDSLLENSGLGDQLEVIPVLDGYWPEKPIKKDPRIVIIHLGKNQGMRNAINTGVRIARGKYIMRTDEHCMFAPNYDRVLTKQIRDDWIVTPRRYFLDPIKWERMDIKPVDYEKLVVQDIGNGLNKFTGQPWYSRTKERAHKKIDQTMAMQGSCWLMPKSWWEKVIVELQTEGYGTMYQDSHEMVFKTWQAGGKLVVNKRTWFAHKHVKFPRTHQYSRKVFEPCLVYSYEKWRDYYTKKVKPRWKI